MIRMMLGSIQLSARVRIQTMLSRSPTYALPIVLTLAMLSLHACAYSSPATPMVRSPTTVVLATAQPGSGSSPTQTLPAARIPTSTAALQESSGTWDTESVLPSLSEQALTIYKRGLAAGNNPRAFSKVGDGGIASQWFLSVFDANPSYYELGPYPELADTIAYFAGSFGRESLAARAGYSTTRILDPLYALNSLCEVDESPLACELRLHHPSFAIISLGTNQVWAPDLFQQELEQIVRVCIERGVIPILATKGDNLEGDHRINAIIADTAKRHQIPLWNFWVAIQSLPDQGLQVDGEHLTWAENDFGNVDAMTHAWPVRNLSALQLLTHLIEQVTND